jgi:hypothetical protein
VAPLLGEAERLLLDIGWRTRVPQRVVPRQGVGLEDRRRLRRASYADVERAHAVIHVLAPARLQGSKLHRELQHAMRRQVPLFLLVCNEDRERLGVALPSPERVEDLAQQLEAVVVVRLDDLPDLLRPISAGPQACDRAT